MCLFDISFWNNFLASFLAALLIAIIFFFLKEKVFKIPNLSGVIYLKQITKESTYNPYKEMELQYILSLRLEGNKVLGSAEKVYEDSSIGKNKDHVIHYYGENRSVCVIVGSILKRYFSFYDLLEFHSFEENERRKSTTHYSICVRRKYYVFGELIFKDGRFYSTIANQMGSMELNRNEFNKKKQVLSSKIILLCK